MLTTVFAGQRGSGPAGGLGVPAAIVGRALDGPLAPTGTGPCALEGSLAGREAAFANLTPGWNLRLRKLSAPGMTAPRCGSVRTSITLSS